MSSSSQRLLLQLGAGFEYFDGLLAYPFGPSDNVMVDGKLWIGLSLFIPCWIGLKAYNLIEDHHFFAGKMSAKAYANVQIWTSVAVTFGGNLICLSLAQHFGFDVIVPLLMVAYFSALVIESIGVWAMKKTAPIDYKPKSVYMDFSTPWSQVMLKFAGQLFLALFYMRGLAFIDVQQLSWSLWFGAMFTTQIYSYTFAEMGKDFSSHIRTWYALAYCTRDVVLEPEGDTAFKVPRIRVFVQMLLAAIINSIVYWTIFFTVPFMLGSQPDPMSYVLNALAVMYICTLDDNNDRNVFKIDPSPCSEEAVC